jgi:hypothetical protein
LDHQPLLVLTTLILVASARQTPYLACLRVLRLAIWPRSQFQNSSLFYTCLSRTSYYENLPSKKFFPYKSLNARKGKIKYRQATYKICRRVFFVLRVAQVKKAKVFFLTSYIQGHVRGSCLVHQGWSVAKKGGREKEKKKTKEGGLSPQEGDVRKKKRKRPRKVRRWLPQRQGSVCPPPRISFLVHEYLGLEAARLV